ncbi:hypothetical protein OG799_12430 [Micromonospora sp. NBC_00898]|uniref:hypothetical protein n=1 Tax=Micromonospora sp. NBC_00898 TaxID=2975981 RepID=UPI00387048C0|nr:hypothetical protein OG799_12430 [Micromonospora sp. NBC_00898]
MSEKRLPALGVFIFLPQRYGPRMRHIGTLIAAIVIGPSAWILLAIGQDRSVQAFTAAQTSGVFDTGDFARTALLLLAGGILLGLIATLRFSPVGAVLTGVVYAGSYLAMLPRPTWLLHLLGQKVTVAGLHADLAMPVRTGTTLLIGAAMLVAVLSVQRWRRWPQPAVDAPDKEPSDEFTSLATPERDRPLGAEGLGLTAASQTPQPDSTVGTGPQPAGVGATHWANSLRSNSWPRRQSG